LAQAYDFLGRPDEARRARAHIAAPASVPGLAQMSAAAVVAAADAATAPGIAERVGTEPIAAAARTAAPGAGGSASAEQLERRVAHDPRDSASWLAIAELRRSQRDYARAADAYARLVQLGAMSAQSWADYADTLGSLAGGSFSGAAGADIDRALALDPQNTKALWLKASELHQQRRDAEALPIWQKLHALLPTDSPDAQIVAANIAEARSLAGPGADVISGTVSLDARFASRVPPDSILFIYAKAADAPGPPLAVLRTTANAWPVSFQLDDSLAMMPSRRLSQFQNVVIEARLSRSGQALPASGDLYVKSAVLHPGAARKLALVIDREIG
ncbi:MAG: hypothetical protein JOZ89_01400, partial [Gammaproteobacteria bacterium]|nr:hypothetical protein [Gammaproteobacteria bacterium]